MFSLKMNKRNHLYLNLGCLYAVSLFIGIPTCIVPCNLIAELLMSDSMAEHDWGWGTEHMEASGWATTWLWV